MDATKGYIALTDPDWYSGRDLHRLYDLGYVTVTTDHVFRVGDSLRDEFKNGRSYYSLNGSEISVPVDELWQPNKELLDWHGREVFKG